MLLKGQLAYLKQGKHILYTGHLHLNNCGGRWHNFDLDPIWVLRFPSGFGARQGSVKGMHLRMASSASNFEHEQRLRLQHDRRDSKRFCVAKCQQVGGQNNQSNILMGAAIFIGYSGAAFSSQLL